MVETSALVDSYLSTITKPVTCGMIEADLQRDDGFAITMNHLRTMLAEHITIEIMRALPKHLKGCNCDEPSKN